LTESQECEEAFPDHAEVGLFAPALHDGQSFGTLALLKIVRKGNATNDIKAVGGLRPRDSSDIRTRYLRRGSGPVKHVNFAFATLGLDGRLETGHDIIDGIPHIRSHSANSIERKGRREKSSHRLVRFLAFDPYNSPACEALNDGPEDGRMRIVVCVLNERREFSAAC
jgi:hypothetical protein